MEKCYDLKKYLPWRRYALDRNEIGKLESDEEILDETRNPIEQGDSDSQESQQATSGNKDATLLLYDRQDDDNDNRHCQVSGSDTEDEIQRIQSK